MPALLDGRYVKAEEERASPLLSSATNRLSHALTQDLDAWMTLSSRVLKLSGLYSLPDVLCLLHTIPCSTTHELERVSNCGTAEPPNGRNAECC